MQYKPTRSLCATVAIAATLALGSTSYAQETAPVVAIPAAPAPVAAAPAAAPTIAVPPVTVQPTAPQPVAEAASEPAARQAPTPRARAERAAPATRQAAAVAAPVAAAPIAAAPAPVAAPVAPIAASPIDTVAPAPVAEPVAPVANADNGLSGEEIGFLGLLAALGLGGVAFLMTRKRRRGAELEEVETVEYVGPAAAEPAYLKPPVTVAATSVRAQPTYEMPIAEKPVPVYATTDHSGMPDMAEPARTEAVALPEGPVPTGDARDELLDRMVAAEPDEANPFTSAKARRRRARIILQSQEARHGADHGTDGRGQPFDWRTYEAQTQRQREPELA